VANFQTLTRLSGTLCVLACLHSGKVTAQTIDRSLPPTIEQLIREAIESQPASKEQPSPKEKTLLALTKLKNAPWPRVGSFQRVRITTKGEHSKTDAVWLVSESDSELMLLYDDFSLRPLPQTRIGSREAVEYLSEIRSLLARRETAGKDDSVSSPNFFQEGYLDGWSSRPPWYGDAILVLHAYCAATLGHDAECKQLLATALARYPTAIDVILREWPWSSFQRGVELLESGAPRRRVMLQWQQTLKSFPESEYATQVQDDLSQLEVQVAEDDQRNQGAVSEPESLPLVQRIAH